MFDIEYKGANAVIITSKKATMVIDPNTSLFGLKDVKMKDGIELLTEPRFRAQNSDTQIIIDGPGEYEVADFTIRGTAARRHIDSSDQEKATTIYRIECGDVRLGLLGNVDSQLSEEQLEAIGVIDILILPVGGGGYTLDASSATTIVRQVEPKIVVPVHYDDPAITYEVPQDSLDLFTKELGAPFEQTSKLKIKSASSLPQVLTLLQITRS
ncbi:Zn-dependent hydrolase [Candidatus Saccharibacteria bacterium]|nr:Zn-dependent hydrolase [Candidatus Saccharibacteria bacterium]